MLKFHVSVFSPHYSINLLRENLSIGTLFKGNKITDSWQVLVHYQTPAKFPAHPFLAGGFSLLAIHSQDSWEPAAKCLIFRDALIEMPGKIQPLGSASVY